MFSDNDINMDYAMRRLMSVRAPEIPGLHMQLFANQAKFITDHRQQLLDLKNSYDYDLIEYQGAFTEAELHHADIHPKKKLREMAWQELIENGDAFAPRHPWVKTPWLKFKKGEYSKPRKKGRAIVDLGVAASLRGFRIAHFLKQAMDNNPFDYLGGTIEFCKSPDPHRLQSIFERLINPPGRFFFVYFSDDSCLSLRVNGEVKLFNLDISSCDASHSRELFKLLKFMCPPHLKGDMEQLIAQCSAPLKVISTVNRKWKFKIRADSPKLFSGSTITTAINNLANFLIGLAIAEMDFRTTDDIITAARSCVYIVTGTEPLTNYSQLQFLKHSPCYDINGIVRPLLNLGVMLRASGVCNGDLPGRGKLETRAQQFQAGLIQGMYPKAHNSFIDAMRRGNQAPSKQTLETLYHKVQDVDDYPHFYIADDEIAKRYELTSTDIGNLASTARNMTFRSHFCSSVTDKILLADYGLGVPHHSPNQCMTPNGG
jgi:hypothetical protein